MFAAVSDQYRSLTSAFAIARRVAEGQARALSLKDFITLLTLLEKDVPLKRAALDIPGKGLVPESERRTMFSRLTRLRYAILERLYEVRHAREDSERAMEHAEDDLEFSAELQRTSILRLERAERALEAALKEYASVDEVLFARDGAFALEPAGEDKVVELFRMPERGKPEKAAEGQAQQAPQQQRRAPEAERPRTLSLESGLPR